MGKDEMRLCKVPQVRPLLGALPQVPRVQCGARRALLVLPAITTDPRLIANPGSLLENSRLVLGSLVQGVWGLRAGEHPWAQRL